ncbi:Hypothetical predicted protein [Lecanosticta acicola]|uniref:Uncharacterized protein n=1 Tax=Lecanosticta acicola TaxID=111012 RepID=A0AAI9EFL2_9PEZI|nr:Hypothetical predicted protein [Lecanosticta acicola]
MATTVPLPATPESLAYQLRIERRITSLLALLLLLLLALSQLLSNLFRDGGQGIPMRKSRQHQGRDPLHCLASMLDSHSEDGDGNGKEVLLPYGVVPGIMGMLLPLKISPDGGEDGERVTTWMTGSLPIHYPKSLLNADPELRRLHLDLTAAMRRDFSRTSTAEGSGKRLIAVWNSLRRPARIHDDIAERIDAALDLGQKGRWDSWVETVACRWTLNWTASLPLAHGWTKRKGVDCDAWRLQREALGGLRMLLGVVRGMEEFCAWKEEGDDSGEGRRRARIDTPTSLSIARKLKTTILQRIEELAHEEALFTVHLLHHLHPSTHCSHPHDEDDDSTCPPAFIPGATTVPLFPEGNTTTRSNRPFLLQSPSYLYGLLPVPGRPETQEKLHFYAGSYAAAIWAELLADMVVQGINHVIERECAGVVGKSRRLLEDVLRGVEEGRIENESLNDGWQILDQTRDLVREGFGSAHKDEDRDGNESSAALLTGIFAARTRRHDPTGRSHDDDDLDEEECHQLLHRTTSSSSSDEDDDSPLPPLTPTQRNLCTFLLSASHSYSAPLSQRFLSSSPQDKKAGLQNLPMDRVWKGKTWDLEWMRGRITPELEERESDDGVEECLFSALRHGRGNDNGKGRGGIWDDTETYTLAKGSVWIFWLKGSRPAWIVSGGDGGDRGEDEDGEDGSGRQGRRRRTREVLGGGGEEDLGISVDDIIRIRGRGRKVGE